MVVFLSCMVAYSQGAKSESIMESFKNFIPPETIVIRDGKESKMNAIQLVPGDVIKIETGKRIPADIRIIESSEMKVDNSSLTGETEALIRSPECTHKDNPLETKNLAFFGTLCKEGRGKGMVVFTGDRTVIGQIANLAASATAETTPLKREINRFTAFIGVFAFSVGFIFFIVGFGVGYSATTNLIFAIGILTASVPEGLLTTVTVALTVTARNLSLKKVLVKNLEAVETLGSTSCICSDKTGTLTQNKMTLANLWYDNKRFKADNKQKKGPQFKYEYNTEDPGFIILHECAVVCSEANFDETLPVEQEAKISNDQNLTP